MVGAAVVGKEGRAGDDGKSKRIDERVRRKVRHRRTEIGEHRLRRIDRKNASVLVGRHIGDFEHAHKAREKVEGLGRFLGALDLAFENDDVDLGVLVCLTDLAGKEGLDLELGVGRRFHGIDLKGKFVRRKRLEGVLDHGCKPRFLFFSFIPQIVYHKTENKSICRKNFHRTFLISQKTGFGI